jgi:excisionase family DNA binding protein
VAGFYTTHEAARLLGVSLPTVVNWVKARRLKAHRTPGGHRRIAREDLAAFMVRHGMPLPADLSGAAPERRKALVLGEAGPMREGLARQLAAAGYAVEQASSGFPAGAAAARFQPDLVVLAPTAPDGDGDLAGLRCDRDLRTTPVVAVGLADWAERLRDGGCAAVLSRPLEEGALVRAASEVLGVSAARPRTRGRTRPHT